MNFLDEVVEMGAFVVAMLGTITLGFVTLGVASYWLMAPPSCHATGDKMGLTTSWGFWTGCMINLNGQWLEASDVVPIERDGKIIFVPRPIVTFKGEVKP